MPLLEGVVGFIREIRERNIFKNENISTYTIINSKRQLTVLAMWAIGLIKAFNDKSVDIF